MAEGQGKTLRDVAIGESATVRRLTGEGAVKRHIMDMGITKGTEVFVRKVAPLGDPIEVTVRGYELSLRKSEAGTLAGIGGPAALFFGIELVTVNFVGHRKIESSGEGNAGWNGTAARRGNRRAARSGKGRTWEFA